MEALKPLRCLELTVVMLGQLYLGVFSGPIEGILMVISVFVITGICGKDGAIYCIY
jgi:hypothetical protein